FRGRNKIIVRILDLKQILFKFRELTRSKQAGGIRQEGRNDLLVSMLVGVGIQHEVQEGSLETCPVTRKQREPGAGDLCGSPQVQNAEGWTKIPMRFGFKVEMRYFPDAANLNVLIFGETDRDVWVGQIRDTCDKPIQCFLRRGQQLLEFTDSLRNGLHF